MQVVDYTAHGDALYDHLASRFGGAAAFDSVIDCVGSTALYNRCAAYLKPSGKFLCIKGPFHRPIRSVLPTLLGGTPRSFYAVNNAPAGAGAREAGSWLERGWVKEVPIDSRYAMGEVVQVSV